MSRRLLHTVRSKVRYWFHESVRRLRYRAKRHRFGGYDVEIHFHHPKQRLDNYLSFLFLDRPLPQLQAAIREGCFLVDMVHVEPDHRVAQFQRIQVLDPSYPKIRIRGIDVPLSILYEDDDFVVVDKPARLLTHPNLDLRDPSVLAGLAWLGKLYEPPVFNFESGVIHRLDHGTSGCLCVAKTRLGQDSMRRLFRTRRIEKEYVALVRGAFEGSGTIDLPIGRDPVNATKRCIDRTRGKRSITRYSVEESGKTWAQVRLKLETGRTHQIRVHLSALGHPIVGDGLYGGKKGPGRMLLHAGKLSFRHPIRRTDLSVEAPIPREFVEWKAEEEGRE